MVNEEEWDLDASASDDESFEIEMSQDDMIRIPFYQHGHTGEGNHVKGIQPRDRK
ncbi:hypothetical protein [Ammoniphilus sp. YIM 78166]|uniref:hypothetical protein n=1 Tax=Ammoniphilus sp. YIM 78166 TaxID=1644106 RepID=UPI001431E70F|nr:hypothetical protein [Ammoniphilus sp. YIM 78166]